jgi:hypothetical protein
MCYLIPEQQQYWHSVDVAAAPFHVALAVLAAAAVADAPGSADL